MVRDIVTITLSRPLRKLIDRLAEEEFGGNRSMAIEYYLRKGIKAQLPDIAVITEKP